MDKKTQMGASRRAALKWAGAGAMALASSAIWFGAQTSDSVDAPTPPPAAAPVGTAPSPQAALPAAVPFEQYRAAVERPLFHRSRKPFPDRQALAAAQRRAPPPPPPPPPMPPQGYQLRGAILDDASPIAIFEQPGKTDYVKVRQGEKIQGWTLVKVARKEVVLSLGSQSVTWTLAK